MMLNNAGKFEEALKASRTAIDLDTTTFPGYRSLGLSYAGLGKYDEAIEALKTSALFSARHPLPLVELAWVHSLKGEFSESQKILDEFILRSKTEFISAMFLGCVAYFSQKTDEALAYLEQAFEQRDGTFPCINVYQLFSFVRTDPRFQTFIQRMNFPE